MASAPLPQAASFLEASEQLYGLLEPHDDAAFETKTLFKGWTFSNIVGHLYMWNWAADLTLRDGAAFNEFFKKVELHVAQPGATLIDFEREWLGELKGRALLKTWRDHFVVMADSFAKANPSTRVKWAGPDMTVRSKLTARLMETWAHSQAAFDELGIERVSSDRIIADVTRLGVNTYGWTFAVRGVKPPGPLPQLQLSSPSGKETWSFGEGEDLIEGSAEEFCQVVTQVRNVADTQLRVSGSAATAWMAQAQCFAGAPQPPPAPGSRHRRDRAATPAAKL